MASLRDKLRERTLVRGPGGQLTEQTTTGIQQLSQEAGLPAPPLTPLGAAAIGANKDQQKMQGSPAQKQAALSLAAAPQKDLTTAVRTAQARSQMTQEEQAKTEKSQDMQNLGGLGDRVSSFIDAQRQKLVAAQPVAVEVAGQVQGKSTANVFAGKTPEQIISTKNLLAQLRANPDNMELMKQVNIALGYDINQQLDPAKVGELYEAAIDSISRGAAGTVDDKLTVQDLSALPDFGYTPQQLSDLLGIPQDQLLQMNVAQLRDSINNATAQEFTQSQQLQQQAGSLQIGQAERGLARQAGREASATGIRATEADMDRLVQSIANADIVQFGGENYNVEDLLKDETISNIVKDYMEAGEGTDVRTQLEQSEPGLVKFIKDNEAVLADATAKMAAGAQKFAGIQTANKTLLQNTFKAPLAPEIARAILPQAEELQAAAIDPNSVPTLAYANRLSPAERTVMASKLNEAQAKDARTAAQLAELNINHLIELGIGGQNTKWDDLMRYKDTTARIQNMSPTDRNSIYRQAFADVDSAAEAESRVRSGNTLTALGLPSGLSVKNLDPAAILEKLKSQRKDYTLLEAAQPSLVGKNDLVDIKSNLGQVKPPGPETGALRTLYTKLTDAGADGNISGGDIDAANISLDEAIKLEELADSGRGSIDTAAAKEKRRQLAIGYTKSQIDFYNQRDPREQIQILRQAAKQDPKRFDSATIERTVVEPYVARTEALLNKKQRKVRDFRNPMSGFNPWDLTSPDIYYGLVNDPNKMRMNSPIGKTIAMIMYMSYRNGVNPISELQQLQPQFSGNDVDDYALLSTLAAQLGASDKPLSIREMHQLQEAFDVGGLYVSKGESRGKDK